MPRYFFAIHIDSDVQHDDVGTLFDTLEDVRRAAQKLLPAIGYEELPQDGDRRSLAVLVTDEQQHPVYSASLNYTGLMLIRKA